jgi:hypothetical protein
MADEGSAVPDNYIVLDWGDGEYLFRLPVGQIGELQTKCGAGIGKIYSRLMAGRFVDRNGDIVLNPLQADFHYEDIVEVIRLSLIGGGSGEVAGKKVEVTPTMALALIRNYVHPRPLLENWKVASAVLSAFLIGYTDPDAPEKKSLKAKRPPAKAGSTST